MSSSTTATTSFNIVRKMDSVKQMGMVEHIRKRMGMYWPTHDGIPDASVWIFFLDQLANEMGAAFMRGEVSYVDIRYDAGSKTMSMECDSAAATDDLCGICKGGVSSLLGGDSDLAGVEYAMIAALSRRMEIVTCRNGKWYAVQCMDGQVGALERMFPAIMGAENCVRVSFTPAEEFYESEEQIEDVWSYEALQGLGNGLAARCPGLAVSVNGRKYVYKNGAQGLVEKLLEPFGGGTLIYPRSVTRGNVSFAFGAARRDDSVRRAFGRFYINGRDVKNHKVMGRIMEFAVNQLIDNCRHASSGYDFVFVVNGYGPDMDLRRFYAYRKNDWNPEHDPSFKRVQPQIAKCMLMAFKEYMK